MRSKTSDDANDKQLNIAQTIRRYLADIDALEFAYPLAAGALDTSFKSHSEGFAKYLVANSDPNELKKFVRGLGRIIDENKDKKNGDAETSIKKSRGKKISLSIKRESREIDPSVLGLSKVTAARELIARSFVVTLVSQFDAFIAGLVRALYVIKPSILNLHSKTISYSELMELGDAKAVEEILIESEIESILRSSHNDQFIWLEKAFDTQLRKIEQTKWSAFIELTERRNLFVHTDARVSSQYLRVCQLHKVDLGKGLALGATIRITDDYFKNSYSLLAEIGIKLGVVLWRVAAPNDQSNADDFVNEITFDLIKDEKYLLAKDVLHAFIFSIPSANRSDSALRIMVINLAQCLKWLGYNEECHALLKRYDWEATSARYKLAVAVLQNDFKSAQRLMRVAIRSEELSPQDAESWPLFREFRSSNEYKQIEQETAISTP